MTVELILAAELMHRIHGDAGYDEAGTWDSAIPSGYADVSNMQAGVWDARHGRSLLANSNTTTVTFGVST